MVFKRIERLAPWTARLFYDLALMLVAVSVMFNWYAFTRLEKVARQNSHNAAIIKAATGCADADSVSQCKAKIQLQGKGQLVGFLQQEDCWTRRAFAKLPPPTDYTVPCVYP